MKARVAEKNSELLKQQLTKNPDSLVFSRLADTYRKEGDIKLAVELCKQGIEKHPEYVTGRIILGRCYIEQEDYDQAIDEFVSVCKIDRRNQVAIKILADLYVKQGRLETAGDLYRVLLRMDPFDQSFKILSSRFDTTGKIDLFDILSISVTQDAATFSSEIANDFPTEEKYTESPETPVEGMVTGEDVEKSMSEMMDSIPMEYADSSQRGSETLRISGADIDDRMEAIFGGNEKQPTIEASDITERVDTFADFTSKKSSSDSVSGSDISSRIDELFDIPSSKDDDSPQSIEKKFADPKYSITEKIFPNQRLPQSQDSTPTTPSQPLFTHPVIDLHASDITEKEDMKGLVRGSQSGSQDTGIPDYNYGLAGNLDVLSDEFEETIQFDRSILSRLNDEPDYEELASSSPFAAANDTLPDSLHESNNDSGSENLDEIRDAADSQDEEQRDASIQFKLQSLHFPGQPAVSPIIESDDSEGHAAHDALSSSEVGDLSDSGAEVEQPDFIMEDIADDGEEPLIESLNEDGEPDDDIVNEMMEGESAEQIGKTGLVNDMDLLEDPSLFSSGDLVDKLDGLHAGKPTAITESDVSKDQDDLLSTVDITVVGNVTTGMLDTTSDLLGSIDIDDEEDGLYPGNESTDIGFTEGNQEDSISSNNLLELPSSEEQLEDSFDEIFPDSKQGESTRGVDLIEDHEKELMVDSEDDLTMSDDLALSDDKQPDLPEIEIEEVDNAVIQIDDTNISAMAMNDESPDSPDLVQQNVIDLDGTRDPFSDNSLALTENTIENIPSPEKADLLIDTFSEDVNIEHDASVVSDMDVLVIDPQDEQMTGDDVADKIQEILDESDKFGEMEDEIVAENELDIVECTAEQLFSDTTDYVVTPSDGDEMGLFNTLSIDEQSPETRVPPGRLEQGPLASGRSKFEPGIDISADFSAPDGNQNIGAPISMEEFSDFDSEETIVTECASVRDQTGESSNAQQSREYVEIVDIPTGISGADVEQRLEQFFGHDISGSVSEKELIPDDDDAEETMIQDFYTVSGENTATASGTDNLDGVDKVEIGQDVEFVDGDDVTEKGRQSDPQSVEVEQMPEFRAAALFEEHMEALELSVNVENQEEVVEHSHEETVVDHEIDSRDKPYAIPDHVLTPTLADIYFQQGQYLLAQQIYTRLLEKEPDNDKLKSRLDEIKMAMDQEPPVGLHNRHVSMMYSSDNNCKHADDFRNSSEQKDRRPLAGVRIPRKKGASKKASKKKSS